MKAQLDGWATAALALRHARLPGPGLRPLESRQVADGSWVAVCADDRPAPYGTPGTVLLIGRGLTCVGEWETR